VFVWVIVRPVHDELRAEGPDLVDLDAAEKESARVHHEPDYPTALHPSPGSARLGP